MNGTVEEDGFGLDGLPHEELLENGEVGREVLRHFPLLALVDWAFDAFSGLIVLVDAVQAEYMSTVELLGHSEFRIEVFLT